MFVPAAEISSSWAKSLPTVKRVMAADRMRIDFFMVALVLRTGELGSATVGETDNDAAVPGAAIPIVAA